MLYSKQKTDRIISYLKTIYIVVSLYLGSGINVYANNNISRLESVHNSGIILVLFAALAGAVLMAIILKQWLKRTMRKNLRMISMKNTQLSLAIHAGQIEVWGYIVGTRRLYNIQGSVLPEDGLIEDDAMELIHEDDRVRFSSVLEGLRNGEIPKDKILIKSRKKDGEWRDISMEFAVQRDDDGSVRMIVGTHKDVTEELKNKNLLAATRENLNLALQAGNVSTWMYDVKADRMKLLDSCVLNSIDNLTLKENLAYVHPDDRKKKRTIYKELLAGRLENASITFRWRTKDGDYRYLETQMRTKVESGEVTYILGTRKDITNDILLKEELKYETEKAKQAEMLKSAFLANMSHEIRTPLNAIVGFSSMLDTAEASERNEYLKLINTNSEQLLRILTNVMDMSKMDSGTMRLHYIRFDLSKLITELGDEIKRQIDALGKNIQFEIVNPYSHCFVSLDESRISQVIHNLLANAVKYTEQGRITIELKGNKEGIFVSVKDTGIGISNENKQKIFQRFSKINEFIPGTGLGLAICKAIVEAAGGKIGVRSEGVGCGSTFWLSVPCRPELKESLTAPFYG